MITINELADYVISSANAVGDPVSHLKLQKICYYAQAWHLAVYGEPLVDETFEAWVHGPVSPTLYARFRGYRWNSITEDIAAPSIDEGAASHINEVLEVYMGMSGWDLERLTHAEAPWISARGGLQPDEPSNARISNDLMRDFYRQAMQN